MPEVHKVGVKYIGRRPSFHDRLFGTGLDFAQGQTRSIAFDVARKFFGYPSEFERDDAAPQDAPASDDAAELKKAQDKQQEDARKLDELQYLRDQIGRMEKPELQVMAKTKYGQPLDGRTSVQAMREQVVSLIDRFGAV